MKLEIDFLSSSDSLLYNGRHFGLGFVENLDLGIDSEFNSVHFGIYNGSADDGFLIILHKFM